MATSNISSIGIDGKYTLTVGQEFGQPSQEGGEKTTIVSLTTGTFPEDDEDASTWGIWVEYDTGARTFYKGQAIQHVTVTAPAARR